MSDPVELRGARATCVYHLPPEIEHVPEHGDVVFDHDSPGMVVESSAVYNNQGQHMGHLVRTRPLTYDEHMHERATREVRTFFARFET
jgi:hypothetical protein